MTNEKGHRLTACINDYIQLLKPRVISLVLLTACVGLIRAPVHMNPLLAALALLCIALGGGGASALNMWYDSDIDTLMKRTRSRPIPIGSITRKQCFNFGMTLSVLSVFILGSFTNWLAAAFLAFTIFFYLVIYTIFLKRTTPHNVVIGGAAGAFPPIIGWTAATGTVSLESIILFLIIFLWTPPHSWALSLLMKKDYEAACIPMMPNVYGHKSTVTQIFFYSLFMVLSSLFPYLIGFAGAAYGFISSALGIIFMRYAWKLRRAQHYEERIVSAKKLFFFSIFYLSILFAVLLVEISVRRIRHSIV
ncbi:MAG: protoheme IX farnesyltransferase [Candidatus Tokpelaia sp. JSC161]|jgi:protoheme IX farnesyltransferase|nr:MAG: protoheme IX farnesyltransferase [Candidatus Tokpelaia sp. JSC161]